MDAPDIHPALVVDFGAQYVQLIARRVREANIYFEIVPHIMSVTDMSAKEPVVIILSGGPSSVYEEGAPSVDPAIFEAGVSVLSICYGFQTMAYALGGTVDRTGTREHGHTKATMAGDSYLFGGTPDDQIVWMSHGGIVQDVPEGFTVTASTTETPTATFESRERRLYGLQWYPEVGHSQFDQGVLKNFLYEGAGLEPTWIADSTVNEQVAKTREQVSNAQAICALFGGVDSSVAAALVHRAAGDQLTCFFIDHGLSCTGECEQVEDDYARSMGIHVITCDKFECSLSALAGVTEPKAERKAIGREPIRSFEIAQKQIIEEVGAAGGEVKFPVQGTLYPDIVESSDGEGAVNTKSHHSVGGLPEDMIFELVEPLRTLFKDEVRAVGRKLGLPDYLVSRQPFPGPGLGIRIIGEVTCECLDILWAADLIAREELTAAGLDQEIWQCPVVLPADVRFVGVRGDGRTYGHPIVLRPVFSEDTMTADWTCLLYDALVRIFTRTINPVPEVDRVVLDVISKPPATIKWE